MKKGMSAPASEKRREEIWFARALTALRDLGPIGQASAEYIRQHRIRLGFSRQKHSGASWFDWRRLRYGVFLSMRYAGRKPDNRYLCSLLAHEVKHLQQGLLEALSVRGELVAWQLQYDILTQPPAKALRDAWQKLRALDQGSRADLKQAQGLMKEIGGPGYRIDWLPLWPLPAEVAYRLTAAARRFFRFRRA
jgi:hypothetical protein